MDANTGIAVGGSADGGAILRTVDGGETWTRQGSAATQALVGVSFADANNETVVGLGGTILHTTS